MEPAVIPAVQTSARPTNKTLTMLGGTIGLAPLIQPSVSEWWPAIAPAAFAGEGTTALVGAALAGAISLLVAYFIPDRLNTPQ